ncbi:MAG: hypothetical protein IKR85_09225 [Clostridia bacterium]|nr:hypothetical protein [Clostridia bacterium]
MFDVLIITHFWSMRKLKNKSNEAASEIQKPRGGLEGLAHPTSFRSGGVYAARTRFLRRERSEAKTTGANNRFRSVFAPGKSRGIFSKNCYPASALPKAERFI